MYFFTKSTWSQSVAAYNKENTALWRSYSELNISADWGVKMIEREREDFCFCHPFNNFPWNSSDGHLQRKGRDQLWKADTLPCHSLCTPPKLSAYAHSMHPWGFCPGIFQNSPCYCCSKNFRDSIKVFGLEFQLEKTGLFLWVLLHTLFQ